MDKGKWPGHSGPHRADRIEDKEYKEYKEEVMYDTRVFQQEKAIEDQFAELNKVYPATVRRSKVIELDLMTIDEAIDAMEAVGHDFFVFRELESGELQILYRRQASGYGILVPQNRA
uniref:Sigma 54 modulation/S30EA ribosomal protein C-terminal domain-containing protein n=2 Tax=Chlamydomonas euryale TaxID=1486919 RepID=A0A7R9YU51_9CHLO|mmetsp:Transcript_25726/g.76140  ORF Transcript_25726/g.76140 Transcript_25726/m.76140 type:complete len:117 (+) Transcript_25726:616-966(+)